MKNIGINVIDTPDHRGLYPVTVDGTPVMFEKSLQEAKNAAKSVDVDFWRGEMKNWK